MEQINDDISVKKKSDLEGFHWTTHIKSWSLNLKWWSCASAPWFGITWCWFSSPDFFVSPTFLQGLVHVFVSRGRVVECEETQCSEEMFWVMMVNVCACGPGQQHFPGWQELVRRPDVVHSIHRATFRPSDLKVELDGCWKPSISPLAHKNRKDSFSMERLSDWLKRIKSVNKRAAVFRCL